MASTVKRILVTGALGQMGTELTAVLQARYGYDRVIASDIRMPTSGSISDRSCFELVDCTRLRQIQDMVSRYQVGTIYHLAGLLSAVAEDRPQVAWDVNMGGLYRVLEVARQHRCALFFPSSIGAFGPSTPHQLTPQDTIQRPITMYGITKVTGELLCDYYHSRFGLDTRGLRLPGIISYMTPPGGGTTDYAVEIFHQALRYQHYTCFLKPDCRLDMIYMPDAIQGIIKIMEANPVCLKHRNAFNVTALSVTPEQLANEINKYIADFRIDYHVDPVRQAIADSWPDSLDDSAAREEWGWDPKYNLERLTKDMLQNLKRKLNITV